MPNITLYINFDYSDPGRDLISAASEEVASVDGSLSLTDRVGEYPAYITPKMREWYSTYVRLIRKPAVDQVEAQLKRIAQPDQTGAALLERRIDEITEQSIKDKREAKLQHMEQKQVPYAKLAAHFKEFQSASQNYDERKRKRGRDPKVLGLGYWLALGFVGVFEAFINFEAFSQLSFMTPFTALGSTVIIALLLAASSHLIGSFLRQIQAFFGDAGGSEATRQGIFMIIKGVLGLAVVLAAVWYARANFLADAILERAIIGGQEPTWLATVGGSLILNLGVWLVGVILSYLWHDPDPDFPDFLKTKEKHAKEYYKLREQLSKELNKKVRQIDGKTSEAIEDARRLDASMQDKPEYQSAREAFSRIQAKDAEVIAILQGYVNALCRSIKQAELQITRPIEVADEHFGEESLERVPITATEYAALSVNLKHI